MVGMISPRHLTQELRAWPGIRWVIAAIVGLGVLAGMVAASGLAATPPGGGPGMPWWAYPVIGAGSVLTGLLVAGYFRAPLGAEATFCDLRWPLFGLLGMAMATGSRETGGTFAGLLVGPPGSLADLTRLAVGVASVTVVAWALSGRLGLEREALAAQAGGDDLATCTTCRPLFPARTPGRAGATAPEEPRERVNWKIPPGV